MPPLHIPPKLNNHEAIVAHHLPTIGVAVNLAHTILPAVHLTAYTTCLPVYSNMQSLCNRGHPQARPVPRHLVGRQAHPALQPLGRQRL